MLVALVAPDHNGHLEQTIYSEAVSLSANIVQRCCPSCVYHETRPILNCPNQTEHLVISRDFAMGRAPTFSAHFRTIILHSIHSLLPSPPPLAISTPCDTRCHPIRRRIARACVGLTGFKCNDKRMHSERARTLTLSHTHEQTKLSELQHAPHTCVDSPPALTLCGLALRSREFFQLQVAAAAKRKFFKSLAHRP